MSHLTDIKRQAERTIAMQAATIERCEAIATRCTGPGRIADLLLADRPLTPAEWAEIEAHELSLETPQ